MHSIAIGLLALSARLVSAQSPATVANATNGVINVTVGGNSSTPFQFSPANLVAPNGTVITFTWAGAPGNHSITQSAFSPPCQPLAGGFDSGVIVVPAGTAASDAPSWNLTVTDDQQPIWFYCKQVIPEFHCNAGMVGAINAPTTGNTFEAFQTASEASQNVTGLTEPGSDGSLVGVSATGAPGPLTASGIQPFGLPGGATASGAAASGAAASGSGSSTTSAPSTTGSTSAGAVTSANVWVVLVAALFGVTLA